MECGQYPHSLPEGGGTRGEHPRAHQQGRSSNLLRPLSARGRETSETFASRAGAERFGQLIDAVGPDLALRRLGEIEAAETAGKPRPTLTEYGRKSIAGCTQASAATKERYGKQLESSFGALVKKPIDAITRDDMVAWVQREQKKGTVAAKTISNKRGLLSSIFLDAIRDELITINPCDGVKVRRTQTKEMTFLTPGEFAHVVEHVPEIGKDMVLVLAATVMRFGELTALQVRDIDFDGMSLSISRAWKATTGKGDESPRVRPLGVTKTPRSHRFISMDDAAVTILERLVTGKGIDDFVFVTPGRTPGARDWPAKEGKP